MLFNSSSLSSFLKYKCNTIRVYKKKEKLKKLKTEGEKELVKSYSNINLLEKEKKNLINTNRNLKNEKKILNKSYEESELTKQLNQLKINNKIEEVKLKHQKEEQLMKEKYQKEKEYYMKENDIYINNEKKKYDIKLLENKNDDLNANLNIDLINYEKKLEKDKREIQKAYNTKKLFVNKERNKLNHRKYLSEQNLEFLKEKNELEKNVKQVESYNQILATNNNYLYQRANRYGTLINKVQQKTVYTKIGVNQNCNLNKDKSNEMNKFSINNNPFRTKGYY